MLVAYVPGNQRDSKSGRYFPTCGSCANIVAELGMGTSESVTL